MLYPIKFIPRLKERLWGGHQLLATVKAGKGAKIDPEKCYGESWELSAVPGDESVVANGMLKKNNIEEIIEVYMGSLVGEKNYERFGLTFPLLIKSLDCHDVLSVQVHPDDELAAERHNSYGKTEMWYVSGCEPGAALYVGFKDTSITREEYLSAVNEDRLPEILNRVEVKVGDVFFIPAGTVHALGKGIEVLEIQQTSDVTYRIYDWNRVDDKGNPRELHTALAVDAIDFASDGDKCHIRYEEKVNQAVTMVDCPYFTTNIISLNGEKEFDYASLDSFVLYICTAGEADVTVGGVTEHVTPYELVMVPAEADVVTLKGEAKLLEVYIK
ncbi:MAG: class I mannose-6-phosphate isomerase [Alistipes sp.]|nr:class I mannose-6-phosphate isomerase [Alistipes sp.]